jgi:hypothetical protein
MCACLSLRQRARRWRASAWPKRGRHGVRRTERGTLLKAARGWVARHHIPASFAWRSIGLQAVYEFVET